MENRWPIRPASAQSKPFLGYVELEGRKQGHLKTQHWRSVVERHRGQNRRKKKRREGGGEEEEVGEGMEGT